MGNSPSISMYSLRFGAIRELQQEFVELIRSGTGEEFITVHDADRSCGWRACPLTGSQNLADHRHAIAAFTLQPEVDDPMSRALDEPARSHL